VKVFYLNSHSVGHTIIKQVLSHISRKYLLFKYLLFILFMLLDVAQENHSGSYNRSLVRQWNRPLVFVAQLARQHTRYKQVVDSNLTGSSTKICGFWVLYPVMLLFLYENINS